jgi:hypothetical protein
LNNAYNTTQVFSDSYPHGTHSLLSAWHLSAAVGVPPDFIGPLQATPAALSLLRPRALPPNPPHKHMSKFLFCSLFLGVALGVFGYHFGGSFFAHGVIQKNEEFVYSNTITGVGYMNQGHKYMVSLSDGRVIQALRFRFVDGGWIAQIEPGLWVRGAA